MTSLAFHHRARLRHIAWGLSVFASIFLISACSGNSGGQSVEVVVAAVPPATPASTPCPADEPCKVVHTDVPPEAARANADLAAAKEAVHQIAESGRHQDAYTGLAVLTTANALTVYRVPQHEAFDREVTAVATKHGVKLQLEDASYSRAVLERAKASVLARRAVMAEEGAPLVSMSIRPLGYVQVIVQGNLQAARRVLADLGDRIKVDLGDSGGESGRVSPHNG